MSRSEPLTLVPNGASKDSFEVARHLESTSSYELVLARELGPGGFERWVTLKRFYRTDEQTVASAAREAGAYALVAHAHILRLHSFQLIDDRPTLVLEHVDGLSLERVEQALGTMRLTLGDAAVAHVAFALMAALAAAHDARTPVSGEFRPLVHAGITPGRILLSWGGEVRVTDFRLPGSGETSNDSVVMSMSLMSDDAYQAPEQLAGESASVRTDVYRAALVVYELFARVYATPTEDASARRRPAVPLSSLRPDVPMALVEALERALEPAQELRNISAAELATVIGSNFDLRKGQEELVTALRGLRRGQPRARTDDSGTEEATVIFDREAVRRVVEEATGGSPNSAVGPRLPMGSGSHSGVRPGFPPASSSSPSISHKVSSSRRLGALGAQGGDRPSAHDKDTAPTLPHQDDLEDRATMDPLARSAAAQNGAETPAIGVMSLGGPTPAPISVTTYSSGVQTSPPAAMAPRAPSPLDDEDLPTGKTSRGTFVLIALAVVVLLAGAAMFAMRRGSRPQPAVPPTTPAHACAPATFPDALSARVGRLAAGGGRVADSAVETRRGERVTNPDNHELGRPNRT